MTEKKKTRKKTRVTTISDVLTTDEISGFLEKLNDKRSEIKHIIAVYIDRDGEAHYAPDEEMLFSDAVGLLAWAQHRALHDNDDNEEE